MISQDRLDIRPAATVDDSFKQLYQQGPYNPDGTYNPSLEGFGYHPLPAYPGMQAVGNTPLAPQAAPWGSQPNPGSGATQPSQPWMQTWGGGLSGPQGLGPVPGQGTGAPSGPQGGSLVQPVQPAQPGVQPNDPFGGGGNYQNTSYATQNNPWGYFNGLDFDKLWGQMDDYGKVDPWAQPAPARPEPPKTAAAAPPPKPELAGKVFSRDQWSGTGINPHFKAGRDVTDTPYVKGVFEKWGQEGVDNLFAPTQHSGPVNNNGGPNQMYNVWGVGA